MDWLSTNWQFCVLIAMFVGGLKWIDAKFDRLNEKLVDIDKRLTVVETILQK